MFVYLIIVKMFSNWAKALFKGWVEVMEFWANVANLGWVGGGAVEG